MAKYNISVDLTKKWNKNFTVYANSEAEAEEKLEEIIVKYYDDNVDYEVCCCDEE